MILTQNYLQFENNFYKPNKGVAMGGTISGLIVEIFIQFYRHLIVKYMLKTHNIVSYNRYVHDILTFLMVTTYQRKY
jgi:hypothetical protein